MIEIDDVRSSVKQLLKGQDYHFCDRLQHSSQGNAVGITVFTGSVQGNGLRAV
jgi:hypothetical protein